MPWHIKLLPLLIREVKDLLVDSRVYSDKQYGDLGTLYIKKFFLLGTCTPIYTNRQF